METRQGQCHCGTIRFEVDLPTGLEQVVRCNCTICAMKGAVMAFAPRSGLRLLAGEGSLATYQFHSHTAKHHFCLRCGIHTFHQRRSDPEQIAVNVACLDGVSPFDFTDLPVIDGQQHPKDTGGGELAIYAIQRLERAARQ
jgi:hypothetical protein